MHIVDQTHAARARSSARGARLIHTHKAYITDINAVFGPDIGPACIARASSPFPESTISIYTSCMLCHTGHTRAQFKTQIIYVQRETKSNNTNKLIIITCHA